MEGLRPYPSNYQGPTSLTLPGDEQLLDANVANPA
jgi:hypothetical protein